MQTPVGRIEPRTGATGVAAVPDRQRLRARWHAFGILWLCLALGGCDDPAPAAEADTAPAKPAAEALPDDPLLKAVHLRAAEHAAQMVPMQPAQRARLEAGEAHMFMNVLQTGRCFTMFAAGGPGVEDLDLLLYDSNDVRIQQALDEGSQPMLGVTTPICPRVAGPHRIEARMTKGAGEVVVQVFRTEP